MTKTEGTTPWTWRGLDAAVCGRKHFRKGTPCQDACLTLSSPRPFAVACDGRGSASGSHWGARDAVKALGNAVTIQHLLLEKLLDLDDPPDNAQFLVELLSDQLYRTACMVQKRCAERRGGTPSDYEFTLLIFVGGTHRGLTLHVGDGAIVGEYEGEARVLSAPVNGEFANETQFARYGRTPQIRTGWIQMTNLTGVALLSDGTGEGLIESGTGNPSPSFTNIWSGMRDDTFTHSDLLEFLTRGDWEPRVQDDRCLALLSRVESMYSPAGKVDSTPETQKRSVSNVAKKPLPPDTAHQTIELVEQKIVRKPDLMPELVDLLRYLVIIHLAILITLFLFAIKTVQPDDTPATRSTEETKQGLNI